jgi:cytochrome c553
MSWHATCSTDVDARNEGAPTMIAADKLAPVAWVIALTIGGCSPDREGPAEPPRMPEAAATNAPSAAPADTATAARDAPIDETAQEYLERREDVQPLESGEIEGDAVGAVVVCAVCHGPDGEGKAALDAPRIGGLPEWYLARQLKYFKTGLRGMNDDDVQGMQMHAIALTLEDDATIEDLAAYLSTLSPPPAPAVTSGDVDQGRELYAVCTACHGDAARGSAALNTPSLVQQSGEYLVRQLENYRTGLRGTQPEDIFGQQMRPIVVGTLKDRQDAVDVVSYIATLRDRPATPAAGGAGMARAEP